MRTRKSYVVSALALLAATAPGCSDSNGNGGSGSSSGRSGSTSGTSGASGSGVSGTSGQSGTEAGASGSTAGSSGSGSGTSGSPTDGGIADASDAGTLCPWRSTWATKTVTTPFAAPNASLTFTPPTIPCTIFKITDYGAQSSSDAGAPDNRMAFNQAVTAAAMHGGVVDVPTGTWLTGAIALQSNVELHLEAGATILFSSKLDDYLPAVTTRWEGLDVKNFSPFVYAYNATNVAITGPGLSATSPGVFDGQGFAVVTGDGLGDAGFDAGVLSDGGPPPVANWWSWKTTSTAEDERIYAYYLDNGLGTANNYGDGGVAEAGTSDAGSADAGASSDATTGTDAAADATLEDANGGTSNDGSVVPPASGDGGMPSDAAPNDAATSGDGAPTSNLPVPIPTSAMVNGLRPTMIECYGCTNFLVDGIKTQNSAYWNVHPVYSTNVIVQNSNITSNQSGANGDGIDPDSSKNVLIDNVTFSTSDDIISIKSGLNEVGIAVGRPSEEIVVRNITATAGHAISIGSEMSGGVNNVFVTSAATNMLSGMQYLLRIKTLPGRGGTLQNIWYENTSGTGLTKQPIEMTTAYPSPTIPTTFTLGGKTYRYNSALLPYLDHVTLMNVTGMSTAAVSANLAGLANAPLMNLVFDNVNLTGTGNATCTNVASMTLTSSAITGLMGTSCGM